MTPEQLKDLIEDLRVNHEFCPKEVILQAADELERMGGHIDVYVSPSQRNVVLEEVAQEFDKMKAFGDTAASFAVFVRNMKK